jgi:hypothetical protein
MRHLLLTIAILGLTGCGPGPKSAKADEQPAPPKETYTAALQRVGESVAAVKDDTSVIISNTEQTNARLEAIESKLDALLAPAITVPQVIVPEPPAEPAPPVKADAPPAAASSDQRITFQGKPIDVAAWLKRSVTFVDIRGDVDAHLRDHGLEGDFSRFSRSQKLQLHSVAHSYGVPLKSTPARKIVVKAPAVVLPYSSNCPNGNCARQGMYGYSSRSRLFGWRR